MLDSCCVEFCCVDTFLIQVFLFSGGADRIIRLWELDNSLCVQEYRGHGDVVRDVKVITDLHRRVPVCLQ